MDNSYDLLSKEPVVIINQEMIDKVVGKEGREFKDLIIQETGIPNKIVKNLYAHWMIKNDYLKSTLLVLNEIMKNSVIIKPWGRGHNKKQQSGIIAAPIRILEEDYICTIVETRNAQNQISPYTVNIESKIDIQKKLDNNPILDSISTMSQAHYYPISSSETVAKVLENYLLTKEIEKKIIEQTENLDLSEPTPENSSYKPQYRITKRELKQMINECVREVISDIRLQSYP